MEKKIDLTIKNKELLNPLHYCIKCSKPKLLDLILTFKPDININELGYFGGTLLHHAAFIDSFECAKVLLIRGANLCTASENGYFPIHVAAFRCSNNVFNLFIEEGMKLGCSKEKMLKIKDAENNKPLHSAVQACNLPAVKLCLEYGSKIDEINEIDNSTPVHVACAQGSLDILVMMLDTQQDLKNKVLQMKDINKMTPLHKASMFDHVEVVEYLIKNGSNINATDQEKRSPLLLAASRNCVKVVCYLIEKNANFKLRDVKMRNFLHLIVSYTKPFHTLQTCVSIDGQRIPITKIEESYVTSEITAISIHSLHEVIKTLKMVKS
jgi:transient receptor potential cation channel subfamily A protein 1